MQCQHGHLQSFGRELHHPYDGWSRPWVCGGGWVHEAVRILLNSCFWVFFCHRKWYRQLPAYSWIPMPSLVSCSITEKIIHFIIWVTRFCPEVKLAWLGSWCSSKMCIFSEMTFYFCLCQCENICLLGCETWRTVTRWHAWQSIHFWGGCKGLGHFG